jgi:hypothetical protein
LGSLLAIIPLLPSLALAQPLPQPKPRGPGGGCAHSWTASGSFCAPRAGMQDADPAASERHLPVGMDA